MTAPKRKISVSLDDDLVRELEEGGETVSAQVNDAVRNELARRRRHRLLGELVADLEQRSGAVDEKLVAKYVDLLS